LSVTTNPVITNTNIDESKMSSDLPATMKAVVFHGPKKVVVEDRPVPKSTQSFPSRELGKWREEGREIKTSSSN
jgi:hypothetical protein